MPTYGYRCDACGHEFEIFQSIKAKTLRKCPECSKSKLQRLIGTGGAVIFKGGGFWQTDYRSESYKQGAEKDKKAAKESQGDKKTDSTPKTGGGDSGAAKAKEPAAKPAEKSKKDKS